MTDERRHRVLVVDDSAFARKVVREVLSRDPRLEVVGYARDGLDALEKISELRPDVVTLDLVMPGLDGLGVLRALAETSSPPRVVVVTTTDADSRLGLLALEAGAFDIVEKPTTRATDALYEMSDELVDKVVWAARSVEPRRLRSQVQPAPRPETTHGIRLVVIGASTGGPTALGDVLAALPEDFPVPIAAVVHMPRGYTEAFAARLDASCPLHVSEAFDGARLEPGSVVIAPAGAHLRILRARTDEPEPAIVTVLDETPDHSMHRPSVDVLFESAAEALGPAVLGVVLTGMGKDGLVGAQAIHRAGGKLLVQSESSCVVYGMPRAVAEAGLGAEVVPLEQMARAIVERV